MQKSEEDQGFLCNLRSIFAAEFDNAIGPRIVCQVPQRAISEQQFSELSDFIITTPKFARKVVTLRAYNLQVLAFPVCWYHSKFDRGAFLFSLGFVLNNSASIQPYKAVISKFASVLESLENQSAFVSSKRLEPVFQEILSEVYRQLTETGECFLRVNRANCIYLKILPELPPPAPVSEWMVPVPVRDLKNPQLRQQDWDFTLQEVAAHIDGRLSMRQIAGKAELSVQLVAQCLTQLVYYGCIIMVDMFQFSNVYLPVGELRHTLDFNEAALTPLHAASEEEEGREWDGRDPATMDGTMEGLPHSRWGQEPQGIHRLWTVPGLLEACCRFVQVAPAELPSFSHPEAPVLVPIVRHRPSDRFACPTPENDGSNGNSNASSKDDGPEKEVAGRISPALMKRLYASLDRGLTVAEHCLAPGGWFRWGIDPQRFVTFGLANGLIRRLHEYPVGRFGSASLRLFVLMAPGAVLAVSGGPPTGAAGGGGGRNHHLPQSDDPRTQGHEIKRALRHVLQRYSGSLSEEAPSRPPPLPQETMANPEEQKQHHHHHHHQYHHHQHHHQRQRQRHSVSAVEIQERLTQIHHTSQEDRNAWSVLEPVADEVLQCFLDGKQPLDALCCRFGLSRAQVLQLVQLSRPDCELIRR